MGARMYVCICVCPNTEMASQFSPGYAPCLLCSFLHLPDAMLAACRLAAFQKEQLPILVCLNAQRHGTHRHITGTHTYAHTHKYIYIYIYTHALKMILRQYN